MHNSPYNVYKFNYRLDAAYSVPCSKFRKGRHVHISTNSPKLVTTSCFRIYFPILQENPTSTWVYPSFFFADWFFNTTYEKGNIGAFCCNIFAFLLGLFLATQHVSHFHLGIHIPSSFIKT